MCLTAIATVGSALIGAGAASKASTSMTASADKQAGLQGDMYDQTTQRFSPFLQSGERSLGAYNYEMGMGDKPEGYGGMKASPAFDFMLNQGTDSINSSAAMRGKMNSGSTLQAMENTAWGLPLRNRTTGLIGFRVGRLWANLRRAIWRRQGRTTPRARERLTLTQETRRRRDTSGLEMQCSPALIMGCRLMVTSRTKATRKICRHQ